MSEMTFTLTADELARTLARGLRRDRERIASYLATRGVDKDIRQAVLDGMHEPKAAMPAAPTPLPHTEALPARTDATLDVPGRGRFVVPPSSVGLANAPRPTEGVHLGMGMVVVDDPMAVQPSTDEFDVARILGSR